MNNWESTENASISIFWIGGVESVIFAFIVLEHMMFSKYLKQEKFVNSQVSGIIFSFILFPFILYFVLETKTFLFLLLHKNIDSFLKLEDINLLMILGFLLGCSLHEDKGPWWSVSKYVITDLDNLSGFLFCNVKNVSEILSSSHPTRRWGHSLH